MSTGYRVCPLTKGKSKMTKNSLAAQWKKFNEANPKVRIRDAAAQLNTTEMQLVASSCGAANTRLKPDFSKILQRLEKIGSLMALTRNEHVVHEAHGIYRDMKVHEDVALFFAPGIDARLFISKWATAFAVNENDRHSLQFFDASGTAVHKVYVTEKSNQSAYFALVDEFTSANQGVAEEIAEEKTKALTAPTIDPLALRESWQAIRDVHDANKIFQRYTSNQRHEIYQALGEEYGKQFSLDSIEKLLEIASRESIEIRIFVINNAAVQIYSGKVKRLLRTGPWFNVLDAEFNLHLRTDGIGNVWLIKKSTNDGQVTSISVLDNDGVEIMIITDKRKLGEGESLQWQQLCDKI